MTSNTSLEDLLRSLDPLTEELDLENATHTDAVWSTVLSHDVPVKRNGLHGRWDGPSWMARYPRFYGRLRSSFAFTALAVVVVVVLVTGFLTVGSKDAPAPKPTT